MEFRYKNLYIFNPKWILLSLVLWLSLFMFNLWPFVFLAVFCALNAALLIYDRYVDLPIDIELSTFAAVLMTLVFGLKWGILTAILSKTAAIINNRDFNKNSLISMSAYVLAAVLTDMLSGMPVILLGLIVVLAVNAYTFMISKYVLFLSGFEVTMYSASNIFFNAMLFIGFSEFLLRLLQLI